MSKRIRDDRWVLPDHVCPACFKSMPITYKKPKPGQPAVTIESCRHCKSKFQFKISKKILVGSDGKALPLTIDRKVLQLTDNAIKAYQDHKAKEQPIVKRIVNSVGKLFKKDEM